MQLANKLENRVAASKKRQSEKFIVRFPEGMRDRIRNIAETNNRSMNAEIIATLQEKYPPPVISAEFFVNYLREMTKTTNLEEQETRLTAVNNTMKTLGADFQAYISGEDIILRPVSPKK